MTPAAVDNGGPSTLEIQGALFDRGTTLRLVGPTGRTIAASATYVQDAATAYVTFDLSGAAIGAYDVHATTAAGTTVSLADGLTVTAGNGADLQVNLAGPSFVLANQIGVVEVNYGNTGDVDAPAPLIFVTSPSETPVSLTSDMSMPQSIAVFLAASPTGPAGVLRPGTTPSVPVYFQAPVLVIPIRLNM